MTETEKSVIEVMMNRPDNDPWGGVWIGDLDELTGNIQIDGHVNLRDIIRAAQAPILAELRKADRGQGTWRK